ncbi:MAG: AarF/ABC1/UbiB kinase family protein [Deltaproteobacteria bacterium]|nr:AarF/ABC1/UbiB kinase family protein [Deltaproteobacteria bacterium]
MKNEFRKTLLAALQANEGAKIPTSSPGRLGRMALTALTGGAMAITRSRKRDNDDIGIDPQKIVKLVTSVGQMKGIAMKMAQIMSYIDVAIPDEMRDALSVLQTYAQPMPFAKVTHIINDELKDRADALLLQMEEAPVAAASIGQVHRAHVAGRVVAVKVQYPEMHKAIESDFGPASAGTKIASLFYPNARVDDYVKEARGRFLEECNYVHEAHCQNSFAQLYRQHPILFVPDVLSEYCATRVLTTEWVDGRSFDDFLESNPPKETRNRIGEALFEFYLGSLFRHCMYNCDPHPGNYLFCEDGRMAMLDHGCTRQFEPSFVASLAHLTLAVHEDTQPALHNALLRLKIVRADKPYDYDSIRGFLRSFYGPMLKDDICPVDLSSRIEMKEMFKKKQQLMKVAFPGEFTFLYRIRFGLMSVLHRLGAQANWYELETRYVNEFTQKYSILMQ